MDGDTETAYKAVAPPSIRLWILKLPFDVNNLKICFCCTPFDPFVDTETLFLWLGAGFLPGCTPFDPFVDTETFWTAALRKTQFELHPLRSVCGY